MALLYIFGALLKNFKKYFCFTVRDIAIGSVDSESEIFWTFSRSVLHSVIHKCALLEKPYYLKNVYL